MQISLEAPLHQEAHRTLLTEGQGGGDTTAHQARGRIRGKITIEVTTGAIILQDTGIGYQGLYVIMLLFRSDDFERPSR